MCLVLVVVRNWIGSWLQNHPVPASPFYIIDQLTEVEEPLIQSHWKATKRRGFPGVSVYQLENK